eukprot:TRINITY_DN731_c0_g1_i3.p1 TRINITY_DN731_c0_g1~~TRINITY_DN731_c0_g1_i3.p1  ORF type:complete len:111 (+),score=24.98 TRINITY_DN731_c0_g1_i3:99-431(+)
MGTINLWLAMISLKKLGELYDLAAARKIVKKPTLEVVRTKRKGRPIDERAKYDEVVIKTVKGLELRLESAPAMIEDLGRLMNGVLSYYRVQSDLSVNIEDVCLVPLRYSS